VKWVRIFDNAVSSGHKVVFLECYMNLQWHSIYIYIYILVVDLGRLKQDLACGSAIDR
jgi:hypothetical protein